MVILMREAIPALTLMLLGIGVLVGSVSGDVEPNDTFQTSELMYDGTFTGSVSDLKGSEDTDVYSVGVAGFKDIDVTARKLNNGTGVITIEGFFDTGSEMGPDGILIHLTRMGQLKEDTWYNNEPEAKTLYLRVSGNGTYEIDIQFSDRSYDELTEIMNICCLGTFGLICGVMVLITLVFLGFFIFIFWFTSRIMSRDRRKVEKGGITRAGREPRMVKKKTRKKKSPRSLKACPHCGSDLVFPRTPKFCPYCDRRISIEAPEPGEFTKNGDFY